MRTFFVDFMKIRDIAMTMSLNIIPVGDECIVRISDQNDSPVVEHEFRQS